MEEASARERKRPREGDASEGDTRMREVWKRLLEAAAWEPQYTYLPFADTLKVPGVRVCLFAVIAEIGAAVHSRGTDFTVTLRIVDESRKARISATFFADNTALLPCVKSSGDVISLHDVVVLHVRENSGKWIFYVWDGTNTPAAKFQAISDAEAVESPLLLEGLPLPREVLCTMPCVGTVLRIFSDRSVNKVLHMQKGIHWARFCNITCSCKQEFGIWKGVFLYSSRVRLLSHEDGSVVDRLKMYDSRNANKVHRQPMASFPSNVADVEYEKAGYSTLMESLTHHEVTHKLKTLVRVVAAYPRRASELRLLSTRKYCIRLTLEDPTARIDAYVHKDNVVKFFGGFMTEEVVIKKMNKLLGVPEPEDSEEVAPLTRNPPWIWCCWIWFFLSQQISE